MDLCNPHCQRNLSLPLLWANCKNRGAGRLPCLSIPLQFFPRLNHGPACFLTLYFLCTVFMIPCFPGNMYLHKKLFREFPKDHPLRLHGKFHPFSSHRMFKCQPTGGKCHILSWHRCPVSGICPQWVTVSGKLHPDLMMASGL